jgi:hypothetical protein
MRVILARAAAASALIAILACSSLGVCWRQLARDSHDCCTDRGAMTQKARPCAAAVASETAVKVVPPAGTVITFEGPLPAPAAGTASVAPVPALLPQSPPLVLRV